MANKTRWNSEFRLNKCVLEHRTELTEALTINNASHLALNDLEFNTLAESVSLFSVFEEATGILQKDKISTSSQVLVIVQKLELALLAFETDIANASAVREKILCSLQRRFSFVRTSSLLIIAAVLNPMVKMSFTQNDEVRPSRRQFVYKRSEVEKVFYGFFDEKIPIEVSSLGT